MIVEIDKYELDRLRWQLFKYKEKYADLERQLDQEEATYIVKLLLN